MPFQASLVVHEAVSGLLKCYTAKFPGTKMFVSSTSFPIFHSTGGSMLAADISCIKQLYSASDTWKKVVIVAGTELPLVTEREFRRVMSTTFGNSVRVDFNTLQTRLQMIYPGTSKV